MEAILSFLIYVALAGLTLGQINRAPVFLPGGDMNKFSLREDTPVGSSVYTLRGHDPENTRVYYYISGGSFSVNKDTGVVQLIRPLDREVESSIDVIISITDEKVQGQDPNTISLKREITVLDQNDNPPTFQNVPYAFVMEEMTPIGTTVYRGILVTDADIGTNAEIKISCKTDVTPEACKKFDVQGFEIGAGNYRGEIILKENVDYEERSTYTMTVMAEDLSLSGKLNSSVSVIIEIKDVQDQSPVFHNAPYSATVSENSPVGTSVLTVSVHDGDTGNPRPLVLMIQQDKKKYFRLSNRVHNGQGIYSAVLETSVIPIDREDPDILNNGGLYIFQIKAIELIDGKPVGDSVFSNITVVVSDINDQKPQFNKNEFNVTVSEDIGNNTPLPDLNIVVSDMDVGDNAKFSLHLKDVLHSTDVFSVFPSTAIGRTPVIIKVANASKLDYENTEKQMFVFQVIATQEGTTPASATVTVHLSDANDNSPIFKNEQYRLKVSENIPSNISIYTLQANDSDSGIFGKLKYSIKGFGSDKFLVEPHTGKISVASCEKSKCLDYETQKDYSLTYEAEDGGGKVSSVNLFIELNDENDNPPHFLKDEYICELQENAKDIIPPLYVKAVDADGPMQGDGKITYSIKPDNLITSDIISIDSTTGQIKLQRPLKFADTPDNSGLLSVMIQATDGGTPPLTSETRLLIKLQRENDGAPIFLGEPYATSIKENAQEGTSILKIVATDPDGPDNKISYAIESGGEDSFTMDGKTGIISVALGANLDRDLHGTEYKLVVHVIDSHVGAQQTATTTVTIHVEDVNNKPPKFLKESYIQYVSEGLEIGKEILNVTAHDPDNDAKLRYSIVEPITATDKTGSLVLSTASYNYKTAFRIDGTTGQITVNNPLDYTSASVIIFTVQAVDLNASTGSQQKTTVEVTVYIQAQNEMFPVFAPPWTQSNPKIDITVPEETVIGSTLLTLAANDPLTHQPVTHFEKVLTSDPDNFITISPISGLVILNRRLDFEELPLKYITFQVKAIIGEGAEERSSMSKVVINVQDTNDNSPVFSQDSYKTAVPESAKYPHTLLTVLASDKDSGEFGTVEYSVLGDGSDVFSIDKKSGTIQIREDVELDREKQSSYNLQVTATDSPNITTNQRRTSILVMIKILDENDNAPVFNQEVYTAVVPENVPTDFSIITVKATDIDEGRNQEIQYTIIEDVTTEPISYFSVSLESGIVSVIRALTGKGRTEPYALIIRATDRGSPAKHTDVELLIIVSDVSTNDGVPQFIRPTSGEVAYIPENATVGTPVFQVVAFDPDNPSTANGKVAYKFLDDQSNSLESDFEFMIDGATGVISTRLPLDRERKENYTIIIVAFDFGFPPQESHRVLRIYVVDVDDNPPHFIRPLNSQPIEMNVKEEVPLGTVVGHVQGVDEDVGVNAIIDYHIIDGNKDDIFGIRRNNSGGEIYIRNRIDREIKDKYVLTIKVCKPSQSPQTVPKSYEPNNFSEIQVAVNVQDIDDNPPIFESDQYIVGARANGEVDAELITVKAFDPDSSSGSLMYSIKNVTFIRPSKKETKVETENFAIDPSSGQLRSNQNFQSFANGYLDITIEARSGPGSKNVAYTHVKIYILYDGDLLKFVFEKRPDEIKNIIPEFKKDLEMALSQPLTLNIYDTQFYSRSDGSLDFESTSSCFQLLDKDVMLEPKRVMNILDAKKSPNVEKLYKTYNILGIEQCIPNKEEYKMSWSEISVLVVAAIIAVAAFTVAIIVCIMYSRYKKKIRLMYYHNMIVGEQSGPLSTLSPAEQQRIYEWQEMNTPMADAASFRSYPTLR